MNISVYTELRDVDLVNLLKEGNRNAFTELFKRYNRLLVVHAYKVIKDKDEAKDVVQDIFISIWDNRENMHIKENFAGFLYTTIKNKILDKILHQKVEEKYLESLKSFFEKGEANADHLLRTKQLQSIIDKEISYLPVKMQEIFKLSRNENLSHKEISERLHLSEKTIKKQVNNALKILRLKLGLLVYLYLLFH